MSFKLTKRLQLAAGLVRADKKTADVGTDHGYLPAFLVLNGITNTAIAADIGIGPLMNARKTAEKYGISDKIELIQSDGLDKIPSDTKEIVIAGMGGNLIAEILCKAEWIKNDDIHLVLQPMTHSQDVRQFLCENGFYIDSEKTTEDKGKIYIVISAYYDGNAHDEDIFYYYFGDILSTDSDTDREYIKKQYSYIKSRCRGLELSGDDALAKELGNVLKEADERGYSD